MALKKIIPPATSKANGSKRFENEAPIGNKADPSHPPSKDATDKHKIGTSNPGTKPSNLPKPAPNAVEKASGKTVPEKAPAVTKPEPQKTVAATVSKVVASKADVTGKGKPPAQPASKAALPIPSVKPTAAKAIPPKTDSKVGVKNIVPAATKIKPAALPVRKQSVAAIPISRKQSVATPSVAAKSAPAKSQLPKAAPEKANAVNAKDKIAAAPAHTKSSNAKPTTATKGAISSPVKSAAPSEPIAAKASAPVKTLPAKTVNAESPKQKPNPESRLTAEKGFKSAVALPTPSKSSAPSPSMAVSAIDKRDQTAISPANTSRLPISIPLKPSTASAPLDQTRSRAASEKKSQSKTIAKSSHNIKNAAGRGTGSVKKLAAPESKMQSVAAGATQTAATISGKKDAQPTIAKIKPVTAGFSVAKPVAAHFKAAIDKKSQGHSRVSSPAPESESKNAKPPRVSSPAPEIEKLKSQKPSPAPIVEKAKSQKPSRVSSPALEIAKNNEKPAPQAPLSFKKSKLPEPVESPPRARPTTKEAKSKAGLSKPITPKTIQKSRFKSLIPVRKRAINSKIDITLRELSKTVHSINILHAKARKSGLITGNRKTSMSMHLETTDPDATEASIRADYEVERQERTKLERANADLHQQISVMQRRLLKEQEKLRGFPKINMQVPTSVEANMHLRFQYMKNLDMQREKYNGLERENINLVRKLDELAMMNVKDKKAMSIEEQVLHTNEVAFWRSKVRELEQEKEKLAEAMTEFEKIAAKEAGEKERLVKEMAFLKQCQLHVRSSLTSEYIEDPLGSRRQSKDSYRRSSIAHPTHDDPERVLSPGRHVTINSTESDFMDMHEDDRKQSMLSDDESLPKNSSTKKTVRKLVSTPHRSSLAQSPRRQSVKPETNESKLAGFNTAIDKPGIKGLEGLGDSVVNSPPPSKKASLLPTKDVKPIDMKVKDISSEPKSANEPKSEKAANIADVKAGKAAEKELKPVVSRSRSGSAVKDDKKGKFELTDSHSRSNSKTSPNPTEKPTPKKTKDDKAAVAIPVKVDKSPKIEKPLGKIPDKPKKEPEVPKTQKSKANNAEEPASNPASKAKEAAAIEPKKEIKGKKGSDIPAEKATPKMARPSTKDSESKDIVPELKESRSHSRSKSSPTEMKATNKTRSRVQSEKDDMIRSAKIQLEYEAYVTKPTEPAASKAAKPKILEQIEPAPLKAAKSNAAGR